MKKIIITGYNGFVGSHLVDILRDKYKIIGISNTDNFEKNIIKIKKDIRKISINEMPKDIFCIVHLAALTDITYCHNNPSLCFDINVKGTQNMLEIARKRNAKFIFLSTSHVYGIPYKLPLRENYPSNPNSIYASTKLEGEIISQSYSKSYGMNVSILRLFSVYGPKSPQHLVTSKIISQLLTKNVIELGNTSPKRDFVYVEDAVKAIELIIKKSRMSGIYNIGTGKNYSILEICNILKKIAGKNTPIKSVKLQSRKSDIVNVISDSSKIRKIGWKPEFGIEEGLHKTYDWFANK